MAIIGLLDWDLTRWKQPLVFNLDLMKLSYYHKVFCNNIVQMERHFDSSKCTKVYIRKDYEDYEYPEEITMDDKVILGGHALGFRPFPKEIEACPADTSIYENLAKYYRANDYVKVLYNKMIKAQHIRISYDGASVSSFWRQQIDWNGDKERVHYFIIHDYNPGAIKGILTALQEIKRAYPLARFGFKYPVDLSVEDLYAWSKFRKIRGLATFTTSDVIPLDVLDSLCQESQQVLLRVDKDNWTREKLILSLPDFLKQGIFLSRKKITFLLKVDKELFPELEWREVFKFFNEYMKACSFYSNRMIHNPYIYCKYCYYLLSEKDKIAMFYFLRQEHKDFFNMLYTVGSVELKDGKLEARPYTMQEYKTKIRIWEARNGAKSEYFKRNAADKTRRDAESINKQYIYTEW